MDTKYATVVAIVAVGILGSVTISIYLGQSAASPSRIVQTDETTIKSITFNGHQLLTT